MVIHKQMQIFNSVYEFSLLFQFDRHKAGDFPVGFLKKKTPEEIREEKMKMREEERQKREKERKARVLFYCTICSERSKIMMLLLQFKVSPRFNKLNLTLLLFRVKNKTNVPFCNTGRRTGKGKRAS